MTMKYIKALIIPLLALSSLPLWADKKKPKANKNDKAKTEQTDAKSVAKDSLVAKPAPLPTEKDFLTTLEFYIEEHRHDTSSTALDSVYKQLRARHKQLLEQPGEVLPLEVKPQEAKLEQQPQVDSLAMLRNELERSQKGLEELQQKYERELLSLINSYRSMMYNPQRITPVLERAEKDLRPASLEERRGQIALLRDYQRHNDELIKILKDYEANPARLDKLPTTGKKELIASTERALKSSEYYLKAKGKSGELYYLSYRYDEAFRLLELQKQFTNIVISFEPLLKVL